MPFHASERLVAWLRIDATELRYQSAADAHCPVSRPGPMLCAIASAVNMRDPGAMTGINGGVRPAQFDHAGLSSITTFAASKAMRASSSAAKSNVCS